MIESQFQRRLIKELKERLPGCYVIKTDPNYIQGLPDLLILGKNKWASLEVKKEKKSPHRPNQDIHVEKMNELSYAAFIYPENKEEIIDELERAFGFKGTALAV